MPVPASVRTFTTGRADAGARVSDRAVPNLVARARDCPRSVRLGGSREFFVCLFLGMVLFPIVCLDQTIDRRSAGRRRSRPVEGRVLRIRYECARRNAARTKRSRPKSATIYLTLIVCVAVGGACENPERNGELRSDHSELGTNAPHQRLTSGRQTRPISTRSSDSLRKHAWQGQPHLGADMTTRHVL